MSEMIECEELGAAELATWDGTPPLCDEEDLEDVACGCGSTLCPICFGE